MRNGPDGEGVAEEDAPPGRPSVRKRICCAAADVAAEKERAPGFHRGQVYREASRLGDVGVRDPLPTTGVGTLVARPP